MKIGRIVRVLEDKKRRETLVEGDINRKVIISFYYPIDETWKENKQALYMDLYSPREEEFIKSFKNIVALEKDIEKESFIKKIKTNIYNNAPIVDNNKVYPVIIQSTGLGCPRDYMTFNVEALVNGGYVVFTIEHIYDSMLTVFPNGDLIEPSKGEKTQDEKKDLLNIRNDDILFILDELKNLNDEDDVIKNKLDLNKIGVVGHSLGGATVFKSSQYDSRIKAEVLLDASLQFMDLSGEIKDGKSLSTPVLNFRRDGFDYETSMSMFINSFKDNSDAENFKKCVIINDTVLRDSKKNQKDLFNYLSGYKSFIKLNGSNHISFNDYSIIRGENVEDKTSSSKKLHEVINYVTIKFLNEFLCGNKGEYSSFIKNNKYVTLIDEDGRDIV